jgi:hypothetical protein
MLQLMEALMQPRYSPNDNYRPSSTLIFHSILLFTFQT